MTEAVDKWLFEELARRVPADVVLPPFCTYNKAEQSYVVEAWSGRFAIYPHTAAIDMLAGTEVPHDNFYVFLINYLLADKTARPAGEWISEKDLPGGATFFRGPHEVPSRLITRTYGNDLSLLSRRCQTLGGVALGLADCSYRFDIIASIQVAMLYWQGDEDFPPEARILLDKTAMNLPLDVVFGLLCEVCYRIGKSKS